MMSFIVKRYSLVSALLVASVLKESSSAHPHEWAIEVYGGMDEAQLVADYFGLTLVGKVCHIPGRCVYI